MTMSIEALTEILEEELEEAVEVKNKKSFHRFIVLLTNNIVDKQTYKEDTGSIRSDLKEMMKLMESRFGAVDQRFESVQKQMDDRFGAVDQRFESIQQQMDRRFNAVDKKFSMMFTFMSLGFTMLAVLFTVFNFL